MAIKTPAAPASWSFRLERLGRLILGLILITLPLFFWISTHDQFELPKLTLLRLLSVPLIGCWVASQSLSPVWRWRRTPLDLPLLLWSAWLLFKTANSVSASISWRGEYENFAGSLTQLNYSLLFFLCVQLVKSAESARKLLLAFELGCVSVAVYGLFQALQLDFVSWSATSVVVDRYFASMGNPNFLGALMIMGLALVLARALDREHQPGKSALWGFFGFLAGLPLFWLAFYLFFPPGHVFNLQKVLSTGQSGVQHVMLVYFMGLAALIVLIKSGRLRTALDLALGLEALLLFKAMADTGTRGAFAGLLATLGFFASLAIARHLRKLASQGQSALKRALTAGGILLLLFAALTAASFAMGPELSRRMRETFRNPLQAFDASRMNIWGPALNIAREFPMTGTGVDTFKTVFPQFSYSRFAHFDGDNVASRTAHCEPLQVLATLGLIGLILWIWLISAWALAWWRRYHRADALQKIWLLGLGGLATGYLVQNLVSFGVSAITAPFFICLGLLWAGEDSPEWRQKTPKGSAWLLALCLIWLGVGSWAATTAFRADHLYNFGHMVTSQNEILDRAGFQESRNAAQYALNQIGASQKTNPGEVKKEAEFWLNLLSEKEQTPPKNAAEEQQVLPYYRHAAKALLMLLSSIRQEEGVALCPSEVKYHVYLGLAYEELFKLSQSPELRDAWFRRAEASYARGSAMNPRNAYYHGNLGRLYSMRAEAGDLSSLPKAEKNYFDAIHLAPSTRLFYENLILLYSQNGMGEAGLKLLKPLEDREAEMASQLYLSMGSTFYQGTQNGAKDKTRIAAMKQATFEALAKAQQLSPKNADIAYLTGAIYFNENHKKLAKDYMLKALALKPDHEMAKKFIETNRL